MPIVLAHNLGNALSGFDYEDIEGVQYEYPNQYKNKIRMGRRFIYYRGTRDSSGRKRVADYFGHGTIGPVELKSSIETSRNDRRWIAKIDVYKKFSQPVEFRDQSGYLEPSANGRPGYFQQGVREIDEDTYRRIVKLGRGTSGLQRPSDTESGESNGAPLLIPEDFSSLADVPRKAKRRRQGGRPSTRRAYPHKSAWVGKLGEETAFEFLNQKPWASNVRWLERDGIRPGWDIQYTDDSGEEVRVEVKATTLDEMPECDVTANEWRAAKSHRGRYRLYFLTGVGRQQVPKLHQVLDPFGIFQSGDASLEPTGFRFHLNEGGGTEDDV